MFCWLIIGPNLMGFLRASLISYAAEQLLNYGKLPKIFYLM